MPFGKMTCIVKVLVYFTDNTSLEFVYTVSCTPAAKVNHIVPFLLEIFASREKVIYLNNIKQMRIMYLANGDSSPMHMSMSISSIRG